MSKFLTGRIFALVLLFVIYRCLIEHRVIVERYGQNTKTLANTQIHLHSSLYHATFVGQPPNASNRGIVDIVEKENSKDLRTESDIKEDASKIGELGKINRQKDAATQHDVHSDIAIDRDSEKLDVGKDIRRREKDVIELKRNNEINLRGHIKHKELGTRIRFPIVHYPDRNSYFEDMRFTDKDVSIRCVQQVVQIESQNTKSSVTPETSGKKKQIVWYDSTHLGHGLRNSIDSVNFNRCPKSARNCEILNHYIVSGNHRNKGPIQGDAVIMQGSHLPDLPKLFRKDPDQVFVLAERENWWANKSFENFQDPRFQNAQYFANKFNWTMTYRRDSDIYLPYGQIVSNEKYTNTVNYSRIFSWKKYNVAWLVSHCDTPSKRELYVKELQKYIDVRIFGECGDYKCARNDEHCFLHISSTFKFILSFENTYHTNYVTEKLFYWFPKSIIPVVRGGETDYSKYGVPRGTIIDAEKYKSPKKLAKFLLTLGSNEQSYTDYLKRKAGSRVVPMNRLQADAYCDLCERLHNLDSYRQYYPHVGAWFGSKPENRRFCMDFMAEQ